MAEKIFDPSEEAAIEQFARQRGYRTVKEYMRSLIELDAKQTGVPSPLLQDIDEDDASIRASIQQGYREVLSGEVLTEDQFWKAVARDE